MSSIGGPKGPPRRSPALQRFLEAEREKRADKALSGAAEKPQSAATEAPSAREIAGAGDRFADVPALSGTGRAVAGGVTQGLSGQALGGHAGAGQDALSLRLGTMTGSDVNSVERHGLRIVHGPAGKIAEGDLSITKASDLDVLKGVVLLRGSLDLSETLLEPKDLLALSSLERVEGGLALEGNAALSSLGALSRLSHVGGNLYLGFNDGLEVTSLPALARVGGALIVEGNAALRELSLPALADVGGYLHLHENDALADVRFQALRELGGELSILDNPKLLSLDMRALERLGGEIEIVDNGAPVLSGLSLPS